MAALSKRAEAAETPFQPDAGRGLRPASGEGPAMVLPVSPVSVLQDRLTEAFAAPPQASRLQIAGMFIVVLMATWLAGVLLYASL